MAFLLNTVIQPLRKEYGLDLSHRVSYRKDLLDVAAALPDEGVFLLKVSPGFAFCAWGFLRGRPFRRKDIAIEIYLFSFEAFALPQLREAGL
ncbi:MAG TPA: hypothetical protein VLG93_05985 [Sulfuricaulis sp.]|nr:hypothetical protein [Sulfuricaulis sp.]